MSGSNGIGSAPDVQLGTPILDNSGEITDAAPVASVSWTPPLNQNVRLTLDSVPAGTTDLILTVKNPDGTTLVTRDQTTVPEVYDHVYTVAGNYTLTVTGFQGALGKYTIKANPTSGTAAASQAAAVVLTAKDWGQDGGNAVMSEFRSQGPTANLPLHIEVNGKLIEAFLATDANGANSSTAK